MTTKWRSFFSAIVLLFAAGVLRAQTFEIFHAFSGARGEPEASLIAASDGRLYGTAKTAGFFGKGSIYRLTPAGLGGFTFEELHAFAGADGAAPIASLVQASDGLFYGTTSAGGEGDFGTVFVVDASGRLTTLHTFSVGDGSNPSAPLEEGPDGQFYGTTLDGGAYGLGTVFRIDASGNFESLHSFSGYPDQDGSHPYGGLFLAPDGNLYGTASEGGVNNQGTIYRVDAVGALVTIASFDGANGAYPKTGLVRAGNGYFYGVAMYGGLFRVGYLGGLVGVPAAINGEVRGDLAVGSDGKLYGASFGNFSAQAFRLDPSGSDFEIFADLPTYPYAGLLELPDGRFVGASTNGEVYAIDTVGGFDLLSTIKSQEGAGPFGGLIQASDDLLYGTTVGGGEFGGWGTVFRMSLEGAVTTLHSFDGSDGFGPEETLVEGTDGSFYGTTAYPGSGAGGSIFKIDAGGTLTPLHFFNNVEGSDPTGPLVEGPGGEFYGVTMNGGDSFDGTIYKIDSGGTLTKLHDFGGADGVTPRGGLLLSEGSFYGVTSDGGNGLGTLFRYDTDGSLTTLWSFTGGADGGFPLSGLMLASNDQFYGTGTLMIYRTDLAAPPVMLHNFTGDDGSYPHSRLLQAADGYLYGTTQAGGTGPGTIFRTDLIGNLTTIHSFAGPDGSSPNSELLEASDGNLYGTAPSGGPSGAGLIYRLGDPADPQLSALSPTSGRAAGGTALELEGHHLQPSVAISLGGVPAPAALDVDTTRARAISPSLPPGTLNDLVVTNSDSGTATLPGAWFADFLDVPSVHPFHDFIESIVRAGITAGCGNGNYCVNAPVTRAQMSVFLLKAEHGSSYAPLPCAGVFPDVPCPSQFADWIEQLAAEGITGGCGGGKFCPGNPVTRAQMAIFLLKTLFGSSYTPPGAVGIFGDVPVGSFAADWIEDLYGRDITGGCSVSPLLYCPDNPNTRGQMAVFLTRTFDIH